MREKPFTPLHQNAHTAFLHKELKHSSIKTPRRIQHCFFYCPQDHPRLTTKLQTIFETYPKLQGYAERNHSKILHYDGK
jgi:hypothetical protein